MRLRRRRAVSGVASEEQLRALDARYRRQGEWFYGMRSNLLRRVGIRSKKRVLEIGCGTGVVTEELVRRCPGEVVAVDIEAGPMALRPERFEGARRIVAPGEALPFAAASFDLVFTQMLFLWVADVRAVMREAARVLRPGCELLLAAEPDYGGRIEHPAQSALGPRMAGALRDLGADPEVARKLPAALQAEGFQVTMGIHPSLFQPDELTAAWQGEGEFLASLEGRAVDETPPATFLFMPYFWFLARLG
jgi:SAM-dependent methyltransferase